MSFHALSFRLRDYGLRYQRYLCYQIYRGKCRTNRTTELESRKRKESEILSLQIKKRKRTEKTKVTKLRHEPERVCLKDSELPVIESVIGQLWTTLGNAQETLEELTAFYVEVGDESKKKEAFQESGSI